MIPDAKGELPEPLLVSVVAYDNTENATLGSSEQSSRAVVENTTPGSLDAPTHNADASSSEEFEVLSGSCVYDPELSNIFTHVGPLGLEFKLADLCYRKWSRPKSVLDF